MNWHDYTWDVGTSHVIDWYLHREALACAALYNAQCNAPTLSQRIGRYLDGEEEREGLYR